MTQPHINSRQRVLLIEDDDADALLVERALESFSEFELQHVTRMEAALEALSASAFDMALLDLSLPDSFGLEGVIALSKRFPEVPIVVLTGLTDDTLALQSLERGAQDYLAKGQCSPEALIRTMRYAMQRQQIQRENQRLLSELGRQARHDGLTGLVNRRTLMSELECEWHRAPQRHESLACVLIDLDYFKRINDLYGHAAGDTVLQTVAEQLQANCRSLDISGRYGGEEFLAILPHTTEEGAVAWAERLRLSIAAKPISIGSDTLHVTASFGVAVRAANAADCEELIDQADQALRLAKQRGRDQVISHSQVASQADPAGSATDDAFARLTAADIMTPLVATLEAGATLQEATQFLLGLRLDSAPVIDGQGRVTGLISEEELGRALMKPDSWSRPVADVMRKKPPAFASDASATAVHGFLTRTNSRRVLIVEGQRPVGIVSRASILRWREFHDLASRSLLVDLSEPSTDGSRKCETLLTLVEMVGEQAAVLKDALQSSPETPQHVVVACATRIQLLLEDAVVQAQRSNRIGCEHATLASLVG